MATYLIIHREVEALLRFGRVWHVSDGADIGLVAQVDLPFAPRIVNDTRQTGPCHRRIPFQLIFFFFFFNVHRLSSAVLFTKHLTVLALVLKGHGS